MGSMNDYKALVSQARMLWLDENAQRLADAVEGLMGSLEVESRAVEVASRRIFELRAERDALRTENETLRGNLKSLKVFYKDARGDLDALRAQLDGMTTEWSAPDTASVKTVPFWVGYGADERMARATAKALNGPVYTRLVGPWVEVTD